ncbi:hypothetical protein LTR78_006815 [Recurvomyces mirabilis]|uniref:Uncharacterized protein n=1 Tax=Recurvomyces mirabilis TaxID=574656 RepID=A0AAE0WKA9_9PEZI|nr:hypothetical protein LTR78_006815 [Recurvomyces mirabilis]KAK5153195.1 hypothetical protein LTS14_007840 [Recurvomyces mirabilis]
MQATLAAERGGLVLNDRYTKEEYTKRRVYYLSVHPDYKQINGLVPIARRDANIIFHSDEPALSIQNIRRREMLKYMEPLLPLPTTENTDTIDSFRSYPAEEWTPVRRASRARNRRATSLPAHIPATTVKDLTENAVSSLAEIDQSKKVQDTPTHLTHAANNATSVDEQTRARSRSPFQNQYIGASTSLTRPTNSSPINDMFTLATSAFQSSPLGVKRFSSPSVANMYQSELIHHIMDNLTSANPATSRNLYASRNTSALAGRGMHFPVKQKRGTKRKAETPEPEPTDSVVDGGGQAPSETSSMDDQQGSKKKFKLLGPRNPSQTSSQAGTPEPEVQAPKERKLKSKSAANAKVATSAPAKRRGSATKSHLEAVIAGTALPETKAEATQAATLRYDRLLAAHKATLQAARAATTAASSGTAPRKYSKDARAPDFPPEFFSRANFPRGEEEDSVRCVCGARDDDGGQMFCIMTPEAQTDDILLNLYSPLVNHDPAWYEKMQFIYHMPRAQTYSLAPLTAWLEQINPVNRS